MIKNLKTAVITLSLSFVSLFAVSPALVHASTFTSQSGQTICQGVGEIDSTGGCDTNTSTGDLNSIIGTVLNILSIVVGIVAVIMIIVAGLKYVLSGGESAAVNSAKNTLLFSVIGLVIVAVAQIIVHFVLSNVG